MEIVTPALQALKVIIPVVDEQRSCEVLFRAILKSKGTSGLMKREEDEEEKLLAPPFTKNKKEGLLILL